VTTPPSVLAYRKRQKRAGMLYVGMWIHKSLVARARQQIAQDETLRKQTRTPSGKGEM